MAQVDLTRYTLATYMRIVTYKTAYYSFYLPVACGLLIGGVGQPEALDLAKNICVEMGQYFQVPVVMSTHPHKLDIWMALPCSETAIGNAIFSDTGCDVHQST